MKKFLVWGIPALLLVGLIVWRFTVKISANAQVNQQRSASGRAAAVELATASGRLIESGIQSVGNIESPFKVDIAPKSTGRIDFLQVREGDKVTAGQVVLKIDPSSLEGSLLQQEAAAAAARSRLAQAKITQVSTDVGVTSQIRQQQANLYSGQANLNQLQQNLDATTTQVRAQHNNNRTSNAPNY